MKTIVYVSNEGFFDVDFPVLKELNKIYNLIWIPVLRINGWYTPEEIEIFCQENSIKYIPLVQKYKYKDPRILGFYLKLISTIRSAKPDLIYFQYFGVPVFHLLTPAFLGKDKIVMAIHDVQQHYKMDHGRILNLYFDYILDSFKYFQVFSASQLAIFKDRYPRKLVFAADLYLKDFGQPSIRKTNNARTNFLFFGIIRKNKGLDLMIKAFNELSKIRNDFTVTIAGDAKDWSEYERLIVDAEPYNLIIRKIKNSEIPNLFTQADYLILPYVDVTQSGVLLTAYNYELPAIASDLEGFREYIVDGSNGFLFKPGDLNSLVEKISLVLDNQDKLNQNIIGNLRGFIEHKINIDTISKQYALFFDNVLKLNDSKND